MGVEVKAPAGNWRVEHTNLPFEKRIWGLGFHGSLVVIQASDLKLSTIYKGKEASGVNPIFSQLLHSKTQFLRLQIS
jgi:hypothetical protein